MPERIQMKRVKGFKLPPNTKLCMRPGPYGNPYSVDPQLPRVIAGPSAVQLFRTYAEIMLKSDPEWLEPLRGFDLACTCPLEDEQGNPVSCHVDVLLELANR